MRNAFHCVVCFIDDDTTCTMMMMNDEEKTKKKSYILKLLTLLYAPFVLVHCCAVNKNINLAFRRQAKHLTYSYYTFMSRLI